MPTKIKTLNRKTLASLRTQMEAALITVAYETGVSIEVGRCKFDRDGKFCTFKVECLTKAEDGTTHSKKAQAFIDSAAMYDLKPEDLGTMILSMNGYSYKIIGLNTRAPKRPILCERSDNKRTYCFPSERIVVLLGRTTKKAGNIFGTVPV